jgi:uncharacterized surface protein with fasciclin (FAS1) repeats
MEDNNSKSILVIAAIVAVFVLGGLGFWALSMNDDESNVSENNSQTTSEMEQPESEAVASNTIVELAQATPDLSTLVTAVVASDLAETLSGDGPFTVLAPTNEAFANLPAGTLDTLLLPENKADLTSILTYHAIAGDVMSSDLTNGQVVTTVNGATLTVEINDTGVYFVDANGGKAKVTTADVDASNGTVHIINAVLLP